MGVPAWEGGVQILLTPSAEGGIGKHTMLSWAMSWPSSGVAREGEPSASLLPDSAAITEP